MHHHPVVMDGRKEGNSSRDKRSMTRSSRSSALLSRASPLRRHYSEYAVAGIAHNNDRKAEILLRFFACTTRRR